MATDQPAPTVLLIVDPDGWLHELPRQLFTEWCEVNGITRSDNLLEHATDGRRAQDTHWLVQLARPLLLCDVPHTV